MTVNALIARCQALGVTLAPGPEGKLRVSPPRVLPEEIREELKRHKAEVLAALIRQAAERPRPYINAQDELIIPLNADPRYHWWKLGGQSIAQTLAELNAPPEVWRRYVEAYTETVQ